MERPEKLKEVSRFIQDNFIDLHQITIDLLEDVEEAFISHDEENEDGFFEANIHVCHYNITLVLEIINPALEKEIYALKELEKITDL